MLAYSPHGFITLLRSPMRWNTHRNRLLATPIHRVGLTLRSPLLSRCIAALHRELSAAGIRFRPRCYLSNGWGCPDLVPLIGIPFYLARADLRRLHREMGYDVEDTRTVMRLLRHEAGHAFCYAYRLHARRDWQELFGSFDKAYSDQYIPNPFSTAHVTHAKHYYAQKHPDEDFAESFAVWLAPRSGWRRAYAGTPAIAKLRFVGEVVREIGHAPPRIRGGTKDVPVEEMRYTLLDYYGITPGGHAREAGAYMTDVLGRIFSPRAPRGGMRAHVFMRRHARPLIETVSFWSGLDKPKVAHLYRRFERHAANLPLWTSRRQHTRTLIEIASLLTFFVFTYVHTRKYAMREAP